MATKVYKCPPTPSSGTGTFSDDLVGFQLVTGGGLTQANFSFTTSITEKVNRDSRRFRNIRSRRPRPTNSGTQNRNRSGQTQIISN